MSTDSDTPSLHIDSDWKAQAQAEKERLAAEEAKRAAEAEARGGGAPGEMPPADFRGLIGILANQALMGLGTMNDPNGGGGVVVDLEMSKFAIDLLGVLEEKSEGNRTEDESTELTQALAALRGRFVEIQQLVAQQMAAGGGGMPGGPAGPGGMGGPGPGGPAPSGLIDPTA